MEFYIRFVKEGLSPLIFGDAERAEAMQNGLCAMGFFGSWNLSGFAANEYMAKNFDVTVLPQHQMEEEPLSITVSDMP